MKNVRLRGRPTRRSSPAGPAHRAARLLLAGLLAAAAVPATALAAEGMHESDETGTYPVVGCRDAHMRHSEAVRQAAMRHCRGEHEGVIQIFRYKPRKCRHETPNRAPTEVIARVNFVCTGR